MHFGLGLGRGVVLAEDFFAPTYIRMHREFLRGDWNAAHKEQNWKLECLSVFGKNGGQGAEREVYQRLAGVDLGPPRLPATPFVTKNKRVLEDQLEKLDFYTKGQHH
jgi:N-acetylneuraminate lyase